VSVSVFRGQWQDGQTPLVLPLRPASLTPDVPMRTPSVMHQASRLPSVLVFHLGCCYEATVAPDYDGAEDGLVNMGSWLFTYEFLQAFLDQLLSTATTFRTYLRAAVRTYVMATCERIGSDGDLHMRLVLLLEQLSLDRKRSTASKKMYQAFINAVLDYITLQVVSPC